MSLLAFCVDARLPSDARRVIRCLALAAAWQETGGRTVLLAHAATPSLADRLRRTGIRWLPLDALPPGEAVARTLDRFADPGPTPSWIVFDGEPLTAQSSAHARDRGCRLLVIDDRLEPARYQADAIVNPNLDAVWWDYPTDGHTLQMLGPRHALLGPEFAAWQTWRRVTPPVARKVLVTSESPDVAIAISCLRLPNIETQVAGLDHLPDKLAWADVAIGADASTCWESAFMQLPSLILVTTDRERSLVRQLERARVAESLGWAGRTTAVSFARALADFCCDPRARRVQSLEGRRMVDGRGALRVVAMMRALDEALPEDQVALRPASIDDLAPLWRMSNEPSILRTSLYDEPCSLEQFGAWFEARLGGEESRSWVLDFHGHVLAHIRYDRRARGWAEIAIAVLPAFRRRGLAQRLIEHTRRLACEELRVPRLRAVIRRENTASQQLFRKAGFTWTAQRVLEKKSCHLYESWLGDLRPA